MNYPPIGDHGIIGDLNTVALVSLDGSIDFMCFPHFDSPTIFAALLDHDKGGAFKIAPQLGRVTHKQLYLPDTNILLTRFLSADGIAEVSDLMPIEDRPIAHDVVRRVKTVRGEIRFRMVCAPRFDYGRADHQVERTDDGLLFRSNGPDGTVLRLRASVPVEIGHGDGGGDRGGDAIAEFTLHAGETASFILEDGSTDSPSARPHYVAEAFKQTMDFWRNWVGRSTYRGRWRETVNRSALVLKLLTSQRHGSLVAAPTFGLPEEIGGVRNWDYRYSWIRDASFTLYALLRLGFTDEAAGFMDWLCQRCGECRPDGTLQIMYGIDGRGDLTESELGHLEGYMGSQPVRVGNGAYDQLQLDIYGELMDTVYLYNKHAEPISHDLWSRLVPMIEWVCANWRRRDEGIWEVRGGKQEFLYSRLMCWVALDRAIRLAHKRSFPAPLARWHATRDEIYQEIFTHFWNPKRRAFIQHKGSTTLDASALLMPLVKFISPTDPRWLSTLKAIEHELVDDSLVFRYRVGDAAHDGLTGEEGTFNMCSFWYVECLSRAGDLQKARLNFEKALGYANHLGLYAEELGPHGEHLGNFPQAFTHLGLISAAYDLDRRLSDGTPTRHL